MLASKHLLKQIDVEKTSEAWFHQVWRPFWAALDITEKFSYLQHWKASPKWIHAIGIAFDAPDNSDAGADARESGAHLRPLRAMLSASSPIAEF